MRNSYGPLIKDLPLTLADSAYSGSEPEASTSADAPNPDTRSSDDAKDIDYADVSASPSHQPADVKPLKYGQNEPPASAQSPLARLMNKEEHADFRHPAAAEDQRIIWLPKDPLGLVHEIERDLESHDILHSSEGAEMDDKGKVDVTLVALEDDAPKEA